MGESEIEHLPAVGTSGDGRRSNTVSVIADPPEIGTANSAIKSAKRYGPFYLAARDFTTLFTSLHLLPSTFLPLRYRNPLNELCLGKDNILNIIILTVVTIIEPLPILASLPLAFVLPGILVLLGLGLSRLLIQLLCWPVQGPALARSSDDVLGHAEEEKEKYSNERWLFLNGVLTSGHSLQTSLDVISKTFGRPVLGIHNRTFGLWADLVECIAQRSIGYWTSETWVSYEYLKDCCLDRDVRKVVVIAHSQGCIMMSQILDKLYTIIPPDSLAKVEVYTFGSAASYFHNPIRSIQSLPATPLSGASSRVTEESIEEGQIAERTHTTDCRSQRWMGSRSQRLLPYMEHYANSLDMVTRWGMLSSVTTGVREYHGKIFIIHGGRGHFFVQHYMHELFPLSKDKLHQLQKLISRGGLDGNDSKMNVSDEIELKDLPFLDRIAALEKSIGEHQVHLTERLSAKPHFGQPHFLMPSTKIHSAPSELTSRKRSLKRLSKTQDCLGPDLPVPADDDYPRLRSAVDQNETFVTPWEFQSTSQIPKHFSEPKVLISNPSTPKAQARAVFQERVTFEPQVDELKPNIWEDLLAAPTSDPNAEVEGKDSAQAVLGSGLWNKTQVGGDCGRVIYTTDAVTVRECSRLWKYMNGGDPDVK